MEVEDYASSSGGTSDSELYVQDTNDEELCYSSGVLPKLQFRKDFSQACWNDELEMAEIVGKKGRMWTTTGIVRGDRIYYSIEESLFLAEVGALHLLQDNVRLSLEEIYRMVAEGKGGCCWESFEVYRHMKSLGYVVGRHGVPWIMKRVKFNSVSLEATEQIEETFDKEYEDKSVIAELFKSMHIDGAKPMFDVYPPNSMFKKSSPGNPSFVLCLTSGYPPSKAEVENLERRCTGIPLKFCHVEHGRVSFFSFNAVELPVLH